ncbi:hypothetical protein SUGI_0600800 [Cryptomeria japonica]|uniref:non-specific phospholipase C6 isoform X1 n=1 Tax=Cryptomeria japonica TaxID=3369 RepID=UPI002414ADE1|nr:non-specific phospholipase C6 isoform X1 [Cryptomeria japonica]GLJ30364.1 hypothetical protein SUGI_0600800 [Cryptomeria japonica]
MKVFSRQKHKSFLNLFLVFLLLLLPSARSIDGPIKTIVVLVMENRSFDHMVGWMKRLNSEINGVTGQESNPVSTTEENSLRVYFKDDARFVDPDPGHMFESVREQVFGSNLTTANPPPMNGFVQNALSISKNLSETVMKGLKPELIPIYTELVKEFAIFDRWFSSLPGPTHPNRLFVYSGTSHGATSHIAKQLAVGYPQKTIFESLHESGLSFGIYYQNIPATLFYRNLRKLKYIPKFHHYGLKFKRHARKGKLPNLTVIEPRYFDLKLFPANDDHPAHDLANGQKLVKEVYETLRQSPQWNETLFVLTYDEHGGFYDHVPTPVRNVPSPDGIVGPHPHFFKFDRLGVRVPTIMISPWITKGTVVHRPSGPFPSSEYEHSSIPATVRKMFNLSSNFLTYRDAWAGTFESVINVKGTPRTDCPVVLPEVKALRESPANETGKLSEFQKEMVQLAAVINGDHILKSYPDEIGKRMNVREANAYVEDAMSRFVEASMEAIKMGAPDSTIVEMRPSLTTRNP